MSANNTTASLRRIRWSWTIAGIAGVVVIGVGWWKLLAVPAIREQATTLERLNSLRLLVTTEKPDRERLRTIQTKAKEVDAAHSLMMARIPIQSDETGFLRWVSERAEEFEMEVKEFRPVAKATLGDLESRTMRVSSVGSYRSICNFFDSLRRCPRMNRVSTFEIVPNDATKSQFTLTLQVVLYSTLEKEKPKPDHSQQVVKR